MKFFLSLVVVWSIFVSAFAQALPMVRVWRGFAQDRNDLPSFREKINASFLPETVLLGAGRGLLAYMPVLTEPRNLPEIPDEVAFLVYDSKDAYNALRATPRGKRYGDSHFYPGVFAKVSADGFPSKNTLAQFYRAGSFVSSLNEAVAFVVGSPRTDWQTGVHYFRFLRGHKPVTPRLANAYLAKVAELQRSGRVVSGIILADTNYLMEVLQFAHPNELPYVLRDLAAVDRSLTQYLPTFLRPSTVRSVRLDFRDGVKMIFDPNRVISEGLE